ncbi:MAG: DUF4292 domain-containing protein [Bacteroidia bacterium]|nr:DUF4292 domain-containing protein [Bacteroidia bacterium]
MRKNFIHAFPISILWVLFFILLFSCHTTKKAETTTPVIPFHDTAFTSVLEAYKKNIPQFTALTIKADVDYSSGNDAASFGIYMRLKRDSAIWISASALLGIEIIRILIAPDSVKILDRLNNIYYSDNLEALRISFNAGVNVDILQSLICASYITSSIHDTLRSLYLENPDYVLSTVDKKQNNRSDEETSKLPFACDLWCVNPVMRVNKMVVSEPKSSRYVEAKYEDYRVSDAGTFPYLTTITAKDEATQKTALIRITVSKITSTPDVEMPFSVPRKFENRRLVRE